MPIIRYDASRKQFYINPPNREYLTPKEAREKMPRKGIWQKLSYKPYSIIVKKGKTAKLEEKHGYIIESYYYDLDANTHETVCGSCHKNQWLYLQNSPSMMFQTCASCGVTLGLSFSEKAPYVIAEKCIEDPCNFTQACEFWRRVKRNSLRPITEEMEKALGWIP